MNSRDLILNVLTADQAKARFELLDPKNPRVSGLSAYFDNDLVVFVTHGIDDINASDIMSRAEFSHVSFTTWPGIDHRINTFEALMSEYFNNAYIMETAAEARVAAIAKALY